MDQCTDALYCRKCNFAFELDNTGKENSAFDHQQSEEHQNSKEPSDKVSKNVRVIQDNEGKFIGTKEVIIFCQRLGNKKGTICLPCGQKLQSQPVRVKNHLQSGRHVENLRYRASGEERLTKKSINERLNDLLEANQNILEVRGMYVLCHACHADNSEPIRLNYYTVKCHIENAKHIGIVAQSNQTIPEIPVEAGDQYDFTLRRLKYERNELLTKLNVSNATWAGVHYDENEKCNRYFCKCCGFFLNAKKNSKLAIHARREFHRKNVPDEQGRTQNGFEEDLTRIWMTG